jgi:myo-inositol 2-dehydrogenase/D-chiro-inositol 1-dehydrogenase
MHARHLHGGVDQARLIAVLDSVPEAAEKSAHGSAYATNDLNRVLNDNNVDAVLIASPTPLHVGHIRAAAAARKAIFCEKPVALDLPTTEATLAFVKDAGIPFQIGFNRRFDPGIAEVSRILKAGDFGKPEMFRSQSCDPEPPNEQYVATSGGIYLDSAIHDIDCARFMMGEIERVTALGRVLVEPYIGRHQDVDTSILTLEFASGAIGVIQNSRRAVYGHDIRIEVHGENGKLVTEDERATAVWHYKLNAITGNYIRSFIDRFRQAYIRELEAFTLAVLEAREPSPGWLDAVESLRVAVAAQRSLIENRSVAISEII